MDAPRIPLLQAILSHLRRSPQAYHVPGHKLGRGLPGELGSWLGAAGRLDLTEVPGLDDLHAPEAAIRDAQQLAAAAFGAEETFYLINGSTAGNMAMVMAAVRPGEKILVPRNLHKSVLNGLVLADAVPVFLQPDIEPDFGIATAMSVATVRDAIHQHPDARAVLVTSPTYHGICSDLAAIAEVVHAAGMVLLVDEAHGAHFAFHEQLPQTAMAAGADAAVQSTHKMLGSLTQTSMLHVQGPRLDRVRLRKRLQALQSTSPSYLLLASLDAARHQMVTAGRERLQQALDALHVGAERLDALPGLRRLQTVAGSPLDPFKWTIDVTGLGYTGPEVYEHLHQSGYTLELSDPRNVLAVFSYADGARQVDRLVEAFARLEPTAPVAKKAAVYTTAFSQTERPLSLRDAWERQATAVPLTEAVGRVAAEMVIPYPPGIPLVMPGELWTAELVAQVQELIRAGIRFQGTEDARVATVLVIN